MQDEGLQDNWNQVIQELQRRSALPDSGIPALTHSQIAQLRNVQPVAIVNGYAVLNARSSQARKLVEHDLREPIIQVLSARMGTPCNLAVSVSGYEDPQPERSFETPAAEPAPPHDAPPPLGTTYPTAEPQPRQPQADPQKDSKPVTFLHAQEATSWRNLNIEQPVQRAQQTREHISQHNAPSGPPRWSMGAGVRSTGRHALLSTPSKSGAGSTDERSLNGKYTFDSFVIGSSNQFPHAAAVAVAENPAHAYNPLFIWGGSGLGKTHLLHATGNYACELQSGLRVKYVSSEQFTNDFINSMRDDRQESFKRSYRNLDMLMVDDIQFIQGKESTQEEFFHTFNALHQANKQIILSSDRPPKELTTLEDRLRTRFEQGLIVDIQPPDLETRIAILMKKAQMERTELHRDVLELIASRFKNSIRELEGALIRVTAYCSLNHVPITTDTTMKALQDIMPEQSDVTITTAAIMDATAEYFSISLEALRGTSKTRAVAHARQLAMYLCRELTELSLPKIGESFGKDHTTVMYADRKIRNEMKEKPETFGQIQELTQIIKGRGRA
ncbi:chromosomal replication initiator protein DnaA [Corynebacterium sp.]|uniref:chromosomal replication initiator protein DnaA n=1 Tax=Corynebacterium sp. TaxID=1720 RepID=UPI0026DA7DF3|nr:chromosomal replication initiator protein DnaA [Corynebacterium sp.]MDO5077634.1 chromosomal replication initiator protein DnaA [Corynebacterium sp.]